MYVFDQLLAKSLCFLDVLHDQDISDLKFSFLKVFTYTFGNSAIAFTQYPEY